MDDVFDPKINIKIQNRCYNELDIFTSKAKIEHLKNKLYKLFEEYIRKLPHIVSFIRVSSRVAKRGRTWMWKMEVLSLSDLIYVC